MICDREEAERITAYLHVQAPTEQADLAFILGTRYPDPAYIGVELLAAGAVPYLVLTGGINRLTGQPEALEHRRLLLGLGVSDDQLIVEAHSTNTLENVTYALPLISERLSLKAGMAVIVIAKWFHSRRAIMTLKRHFPPGLRYYTRTYNPGGITPDNWFLSEESAAPVLKNWRSIPLYLAQGHLSEIERVGDAAM